MSCHAVDGLLESGLNDWVLTDQQHETPPNALTAGKRHQRLTDDGPDQACRIRGRVGDDLLDEAGLVTLQVALNGVGTIRSLVHLLAPDGGAHSVAGIDVAGGANIVAIFAQWGASQLVLALMIWVVLLRYRALVPLMWLIVLGEQALRLLAGHLKPLASDWRPPGAYGTHILLPLALVILLWSLWTRQSGGDGDNGRRTTS